MPAGRKYARQLTCREAHFGVCATRDGATLQVVLDAANSFLNDMFSAERLFSFARVASISVGGVELDSKIVFCCCLRKRDPRVGLLVSFDWLDAAHTVLKPLMSDGRFIVHTQWSLMRGFRGIGVVDDRFARLTVSRLRTRFAFRGTASVLGHVHVERSDEPTEVVRVGPAANVRATPVPRDSGESDLSRQMLAGFLQMQAVPCGSAPPLAAVVAPSLTHRRPQADRVAVDEAVDGDDGASSASSGGLDVSDVFFDSALDPRPAESVIELSTRGDVGGCASSSAAAPSLPPESPPAAPAAAMGRGPGQRPREQRGASWGHEFGFPWQVARIYSHGIHTGWGATCSQHSNVGDMRATVCKKALTMGATLSDGECQQRIKMWLLEGIRISDADDDARSQHLAMNPRRLRVLSDDEVVAVMAASA